MQHEGISIRTHFRDDERHTLGHQRGHKRHVAGKSIELCHDHRTFAGATSSKRGSESRAPVERIGALSGLDLSELGREGEAFGFGKTCHGGALSLNAEP